MVNKRLSVYLQDHRAGAAAGLALSRRCLGSNRSTPYETDLAEITTAIAEDVNALDRVMAHYQVPRQRPKELLALASERLARLKHNGTVFGYSPLSRQVELEGLTAAVETKKSLWLALMQRDDALPVDLRALAQRAHEQVERLRALHARAAEEALCEN